MPRRLRVAAADIGSNALRYVVVEGVEGRPDHEVVEDRRAAVRLGADVFGDQARISGRNLGRAAEVMRGFARDFRSLAVDRVRVVATSAVREARNRKAFVNRIAREAGLKVDVITGAEEARLVALGVRAQFPAMSRGRHAILDVGGGSAEVILVKDGEVARATSFEIGAVRMLREIGTGHDSHTLLRMAREFADSVRPPLLELLGQPAPKSFSATGGNIEALAKIIGRPLGGDSRMHAIRRPELAELLQTMARLAPAERMTRWDLKADRADVIVPAGVVYSRFAEAAGAKRILVPHVGLRDAVALDLLLGGKATDARDRLENARIGSALAVGRKFRFNEEHARRTARLADRLFQRLRNVERLAAGDRSLLEMAALLHDIGIVISPVRHHKHTAYLIRESELAGVDDEEQELIATIARYHRRGLPSAKHAEYARLDEADQRRVSILAGILRLADALDRDRARPLEDIEVRLRSKRIDIRLKGRGDRLLELWAGRRKKDLLERATGREVVLRKAGP